MSEPVKIIAFFLLLIMGLFIIIWLMLGGKKAHVPKLEELNPDEDFPVYYSDKNSIFPLLAIIAYFLLLFGIVGASSTYGKGIGIVLIVIALPLLIWVIYRVRNAEEQKDRILLTIGHKGISLPSKGWYSWEDVSRVEIEKDVRQNDHLVVFVVNRNKADRIEKVELPAQFSRFAPAYLKNVMILYQNHAQ